MRLNASIWGVIDFSYGTDNLFHSSSWSGRANERLALAGRIVHVENQLLRYVLEIGDWTATVKDAPVGVRDVLYAVPEGRDEILMLDEHWLRMSGNTQVQLITVGPDLSEIDVGSGLTRIYK